MPDRPRGDAAHPALPDARPLAPAAGEESELRSCAFAEMAAAAARDHATRAYFAAILEAQGLSPDECQSIWNAFLAAADARGEPEPTAREAGPRER